MYTWANVRCEGQFETVSGLVQAIWGCLRLYGDSLRLCSTCTGACEGCMRATGGYMDYMGAGLVKATGRCIGQLEAICVLVDAERS